MTKLKAKLKIKIDFAQLEKKFQKVQLKFKIELNTLICLDLQFRKSFLIQLIMHFVIMNLINKVEKLKFNEIKY